MGLKRSLHLDLLMTTSSEAPVRAHFAFGLTVFPSLLSALPLEGAQTFQLRVLCPFFPPSTASSFCSVSGKVFQENSINIRTEESWVRVSFHQPINYLLSIIKAVHGGGLDVPFDLLSGVIVNVDLE